MTTNTQTRRNIRKRKTQKRIKGAGYYESAQPELYKMIKKFITKHSKNIKEIDDMRQAVTEYKEQMKAIDDRDYLAVRNYIWSENPDKIPLFLDIKKRRLSPGTPKSVCDDIGDYFFAVKNKPDNSADSAKWDELTKSIVAIPIRKTVKR